MSKQELRKIAREIKEIKSGLTPKTANLNWKDINSLLRDLEQILAIVVQASNAVKKEDYEKAEYYFEEAESLSDDLELSSILNTLKIEARIEDRIESEL